MSSFLHNVQQNVHNFSKIAKFRVIFEFRVLSKCFISTPKPLIPSKPDASDTKQWDLLA